MLPARAAARVAERRAAGPWVPGGAAGRGTWLGALAGRRGPGGREAAKPALHPDPGNLLPARTRATPAVGVLILAGTEQRRAPGGAAAARPRALKPEPRDR